MAPSKRAVLEQLTRPELQAVADAFGLEVEDRRVRDQLVDAAARSRKVNLAQVLGDFSRDRLKEICRALGLDDGGREKAVLIDRLAGKEALSKPEPALAADARPMTAAPRVPRTAIPFDVAPMAPQAGALALVRHRQYVIDKVAPPAAPGELTRVDLVCLDDDASGRRLEVLWERELGARVWSPSGLGNVTSIDPPRKFAAYLHAVQWNVVTAAEARLFQAPFRAGIKHEAHQLVPLRKALHLPRVNLFIADDVGVGKTIEAGLVMRELLLRQRVDKILIVCPAALTLQWRAELERRFGLRFEVYTRQLVSRRRQELGFGVNVWTTYPRFIVSYQMLRRAEHFDALKTFLDTGREQNLLVMDEAHHAAPSSDSKLYAVDSDTTERIRELAPRFEHRLFLSATPHNGHSNSFTALLEMLDPQRFTRGVALSGPRALEAVMVRRLKKDLKALGCGDFPDRRIVPVELRHRAGRWTETAGAETRDLGPGSDTELVLSRLLDEYRRLVTVKGRGRLVLINLQKRLLSSVAAFARTLVVHAKNIGFLPDKDEEDEEAVTSDDDDEDVELVGETDAALEAEEAVEIGSASHGITVPPGRARDVLQEMLDLARSRADEASPKARALLAWIRRHQCQGAGGAGGDPRWSDRRVIIFTEYAHTKSYLRRLLNAALEETDDGGERVVELHGGMSDARREEVQAAFNTPPEDHPARILLATDTAREGMNLQAYCADLFHYDIPWNPARMEQRNGRIDRVLQPAKEVRCHYFVLADRGEDHVLSTLVKKVETIRQELGSLGDVVLGRMRGVLDDGITADTAARLDRAEELPDRRKQAVATLEEQRTQKKIAREIEEAATIYDRSRQLLLGFSETMLKEVVDVALAQTTGGAALTPTRVGKRDAFLLPELDASWQRTLDSLRPPRARDEAVHEWRRRPPKPVVFEPLERMTDEVEQLHLEHPLVQRLLTRLRALGVGSRELARVTIVRDPKRATARVIAFGRLSHFGAGATRLHDEVIPVAARWAESMASSHLKPFGEAADREAIADLEALLAQSPTLEVKEGVVTQLRKAAAGDFEALWTHVVAEAQAREAEVEKKLAERGATEAADLAEILRQQRALIQRTLDEAAPRQLTLEFDPREREQHERDLVHMRRRLEQIGQEIETEPRRLADGYRVTLRRLEPVGLVYLWPGNR